MGDIEGLIDKVSELKLDDNEELMKKLKQGIRQITCTFVLGAISPVQCYNGFMYRIIGNEHVLTATLALNVHEYAE